MLYKIWKSLLGIKFKLKKSVFLNYMCTKNKSGTKFINHLYLNTFKLKLGCLFDKFSKEKICKSKEINNQNNWIIDCIKSKDWKIMGL